MTRKLVVVGRIDGAAKTVEVEYDTDVFIEQQGETDD